MYEQSSMCASNATSADECLLNISDPKDAGAFEQKSCNQGEVPPFYIEVKEANDAVQAFKYAARSGGKIAIKNSGHTFQKDSSQKGALMLWTRNLRTLKRDRAFVPEGCSARESFSVITTGAGINCGEAYDFAEDNDATIVCAYSATVGLSGGFVQSGGHGVLSPSLGLAVDRVVQFTVVTPDGRVRKANACQNRDLFWALRGGGGGTFGVVIDATHRVENRIPIALASIGVDPASKIAVYGFMEALVDDTLALAKDGWGGHIYGNKIVYVNPKMTSEAQARRSMNKMIQVARRYGGTANITIVPSFHTIYKDYIIPSAQPVGLLTLINLRLMPDRVFFTPQLKRNLKQYFKEFIDAGNLPYIPVSGPYTVKDTTKGTSALPAWKNTIWEFGDAAYWKWNQTLDERIQTVESVQQLSAKYKTLTDGGGAYRNEGNPFNPDWQRDNFGGLYGPLLEVKKRYDPKGVLHCHKCIGWTDEDSQASCFGIFENGKTVQT